MDELASPSSVAVGTLDGDYLTIGLLIPSFAADVLTTILS